MATYVSITDCHKVVYTKIGQDETTDISKFTSDIADKQIEGRQRDDWLPKRNLSVPGFGSRSQRVLKISRRKK